jgi:hypothetical protein
MGEIEGENPEIIHEISGLTLELETMFLGRIMKWN